MQYGGVAANDERKAAEALDAVSDPHWQLLLQVPGTFLVENKEGKQGWGLSGWARTPGTKRKIRG